jgi:hypothetical protein
MTALRAGGKFVCLSTICSMRNSKAQQRLRTANGIVDAKRGRARRFNCAHLWLRMYVGGEGFKHPDAPNPRALLPARRHRQPRHRGA